MSELCECETICNANAKQNSKMSIHSSTPYHVAYTAHFGRVHVVVCSGYAMHNTTLCKILKFALNILVSIYWDIYLHTGPSIVHIYVWSQCICKTFMCKMSYFCRSISELYCSRIHSLTYNIRKTTQYCSAEFEIQNKRNDRKKNRNDRIKNHSHTFRCYLFIVIEWEKGINTAHTREQSYNKYVCTSRRVIL